MFIIIKTECQMRVTRVQAEENRRAVIDAASRLFRERGFDGVGLADLMRAAGLTHGGFYKQFSSKVDLIALACDRALDGSVDNWTRVVDSGAPDVLADLVGMYLSRSHRDRRADGCALAALGGDVVRRIGTPDGAAADDALHQRFGQGVRRHIHMLERAVQASPAHRDLDPLAALSTMVGALLLARLVDDETLSGQILDAASASLLGPGPATRKEPA
jgi:TetR/AcrR family transcriptional repressor of nem operon